MKSSFFLLTLLLLQFTVNAQMKIGDNPTSINSASLLELETTNKGLVLPRIALTDVSSPAPLPAGLLTGTVVFNTNASVTGGDGVGIYVWSDGAWKRPVIVTAGSPGWNLTGNTGTSYITNFIGTIDNASFRVRTNNIQRLLVDSLGNIVIGKGDNTTAPAGDTIRAPNGSGTNIAGGNLTLKGGNASGTATGGALNLFGGISASGAGLQGDVSLQGQSVKAKLRKGGSFLILNDSTPGNELVKLLIRETGEVNWYLDGKDLFMRDGFFNAFGNGRLYKYDFMHIDGVTGRIGFNILGGYSDGSPGGENNLPLTSSVTLMGSIATKIRLLNGTTTYQIQQDDHIMIIDQTNNNNTNMILPPVTTSQGREYIFKRNNNGDGKIIVKPAPGEKLNGIVNSSVTLGNDNSTLEVVCGPDSWWVISEISVTQIAQVTTTSITASDKNIIEVNFTGDDQSIDVGLPAAADNEDRLYTIKRNANGGIFSGNVLRIVPASGENLDQSTFASPYIMANVFQSITVRSNGTNWVILNNYNPENAVVAVTTAYTPYKNDKTILADASSASFTVTLPGAATVEKGKTYTVKRTNAGTNTVIVDGNGSETIDGITSLRLNQRFDYLQLQSDGTNWMVIAERISPSLVINPALPYTATVYDGIIASNGAGTINLPSAAAVLGGKIFTIKNSARAGNRTVTVDPNGSETVDGLATWPLTRGQFVTIQSDGTNWIVIGQ